MDSIGRATSLCPFVWPSSCVSLAALRSARLVFSLSSPLSYPLTSLSALFSLARNVWSPFPEFPIIYSHEFTVALVFFSPSLLFAFSYTQEPPLRYKQYI